MIPPDDNFATFVVHEYNLVSTFYFLIVQMLHTEENLQVGVHFVAVFSLSMTGAACFFLSLRIDFAFGFDSENTI